MHSRFRRRGVLHRPVAGGSLKSLAFMRVCPKARSGWAVLMKPGDLGNSYPLKRNLEVNMKFKSLLFGSVAGLIAVGGAQAADLPVKAKAVEYVKVCSLYGAGFFYIPGTDTCIKLGGYLRVDTSFNTAGVQDQPAWNGDPGQGNRYRDYF